MRLLLVEDDVKLARALQKGLGNEGFAVDVARTGDDGLAQATREEYDAVVLDVMLPGMDGVAVCETLRRRERRVPVLMLTARGEVGARIRGLDVGADDYLVKPFDFGELLARLRALIRRGPPEAGRSLQIGELHIDLAARVVTLGGHRVELTSREFDVLEVLARNAGRLLTRAELRSSVWGDDVEASANIADIYVGYLRRKLERPAGRRLIRTVRGKGFVLEID
jgi:two-component system OmpR family response regulator